MIDPSIKEAMSKIWWLLPSAFFVGLLSIYLEGKISRYNKNRRRNKK